MHDQFANYKAGRFNGYQFLQSAPHLPAATWWNALGKTGLPQLAKLARNVLSMVSAAAGCEHNWSLFGAVSSGKHARIGTGTMSDLVFVRANLGLMHREHMKDADAIAEERLEWMDDDISESESEPESDDSSDLGDII